MGTKMTHECLDVLLVQPAADRWLFIEIGELLNGGIIEDPTHEDQLGTQSLIYHLIDSAL
jgi:hypothetical protein